MTKICNICVAAVIAVVAVACGTGSRSESEKVSGDTITECAELLTMVDCGDYVVADIKDPWDSCRYKRYLLVRDSSADMLPAGIRIDVPLTRSLVYSSVHGGAVAELGMASRVTAVAEGEYFRNPQIADGIRSGRVTDVGSSMNPSIEKIVSHAPQAILASPYQNAGFGAVEALGIPIVECADYMERTPLGRAEWIKLLGVLYGAESRADSIFAAVRHDYDSLRREPSSSGCKVLVEQLTDGVWYVPGGESYMARLIADAGGIYPWADTKGSGSLPLDMGAVATAALDADVWLLKSFGPLTRRGLLNNSPVNGQFKPMKTGRVWVSNTAESPLYDEFPFHPERLLREYITIFGDSTSSGSTRYFQVMEP